jgi:phage terminase large subunit
MTANPLIRLAMREAVIDYTPRAQQRALHADPHRFKVLVAHRRFGKTTFCLNDLIRGAARCPHPQPRFAYIAPYLNQAKDITWSELKRLTLPIPDLRLREDELWIEIPGGRRVRIYGADNADRLRGGYLDGVILDEYAQMNPRVWGDVIRPMLTDRKGWATFIGTPLGRNAFADLYDGATQGFLDTSGTRHKDPDWAGYMFKASETGLIQPAELEAARRALTADQYAQEFECSFDAAIPGAYYAAILQQAELLGRIRPMPYEPALAVHTGWDLGIGDPTAIWFCQVVHGEPRLIDYYEASGVGLDHYVAQLRAGHRAHWVYGQHFFPHDLAVKELGTGMSRVDVLRGYGLSPTVLSQSSLDDGISQARFILRKCWFNAERTGDGLKALRQYRSEWDEKRQVLKPVPLHDWTSHAADAFRYLCIGLGRFLIDRQPLVDAGMSSGARSSLTRQRFAAGAPKGGRAYGW